MSKNTISHTISLRVRYGETDQMGYSYHGNYASYFEVARVETLRHFGFNYKALEEEGYMLPVSHFEVDYLRPAYYDDELFVTTIITELKGPRLFFEYQVHNAEQVLLCTGKTTLVFVGTITKRPVAPPANFVSLING